MTGLAQCVPDAELVARALHADTPAKLAAVFAVIYERHAAAVMRTCGAMLSEPDLAENAAHDAFEAAFGWLAARKAIERPEYLRAWLCGIARNRCRRQWASRAELAPLPAELSDDDDDQASRRRMAQVESMLQAVAATFTEPQQQLYRYVIGEGLSGARLGERMAISAEAASRQAYKVIKLAHDGFGALVLARDGRRFCPVLARILDEGGWHGGDFTPILRKRIVRHISDCQICDNCVVCNRIRRDLVSDYAPALIPILIAAGLRERVLGTIRRTAATRTARREENLPPPPPPAAISAATPGGAPVPQAGPPAAPPTGRRLRRRLPLAAAAAALLLVVITVVTATSRTGQNTTSQPVMLTADSTTCPQKMMVYALCLPASTPTSDGSNPLLGRLLDAGQGGVTAVDRRFSIWFDPSAGAVITTLSQPEPLPPECFDPGADRTTWALSGNGAVETVRVGSAWGEVGIVPLSPATASALRAEVTAQLRSCFVFGLSGSNATVDGDSMSTPVAWMRTFIIRNVGQVPPAYLGDGVSWQYTAWGVTGNDYVYATSFSPSVCRDLAISLASKQ